MHSKKAIMLQWLTPSLPTWPGRKHTRSLFLRFHSYFVRSGPKNDLIDLMDDPVSTPEQSSGSSNPINELVDIFGGSASSSSYNSPHHNGGSGSSSSGFRGLGSIVLPATPQPNPQSPPQLPQFRASPHQFPFPSSSTLNPSFQPLVQQQQTQATAQPQNKDPFADLAGLF